MGTLTYTGSDGSNKTSGFVALQTPDVPYTEAGAVANYYSDIRNVLGASAKNFALASEGFDNLWSAVSNIEQFGRVYDSSVNKTDVGSGYIRFADGTAFQWGGMWGPANQVNFIFPFINDEYTALVTPYCASETDEYSVQLKAKTKTGLTVHFIGIPKFEQKQVQAILPCSVSCQDTQPEGNIAYYAAQGNAVGTITDTQPVWPSAPYACQWLAVGRWK